VRGVLRFTRTEDRGVWPTSAVEFGTGARLRS